MSSGKRSIASLKLCCRWVLSICLTISNSTNMSIPVRTKTTPTTPTRIKSIGRRNTLAFSPYKNIKTHMSQTSITNIPKTNLPIKTISTPYHLLAFLATKISLTPAKSLMLTKPPPKNPTTKWKPKSPNSIKYLTNILPNHTQIHIQSKNYQLFLSKIIYRTKITTNSEAQMFIRQNKLTI